MCRTLRIEVEVPKGTFAQEDPQGLGRKYCVNFNILRGRVTPKGAWYLLDLSGADSKVGAVVRLFQRKGIPIRMHGLETSAVG
jgi:hypothetical protein